MTELHYDRPLFTNEVRCERSESGVRIIIGPRTAWQVLASLDFNLCVMLAIAVAFAAGAIFAACLLSYVRGEDFAVLLYSGLGLAAVGATIGAAFCASYRRRLGRTVLTVSSTDVGVDPAADRFATIWVPRTRVTSVKMVGLRFRLFARDAQRLQLGLVAAAPIVALSGYPRDVVQPIVDEIRASLAREERQATGTPGKATPATPLYVHSHAFLSPYTPLEAPSDGAMH